MKPSPSLTSAERDGLLAILKSRFEAHPGRHPKLDWAGLRARLEASPAKLRSLHAMEQTGGEPDLLGHDSATGELRFVDFSPETPKGRISLCYDREALDSRKEPKPKDNAIDLAAAMGVDLLSETQYQELQALGEFDLKTSSWLKTPDDIRQRGGALFGDRRFGRVFIYHNGAQSYFAARGFRAVLTV